MRKYILFLLFASCTGLNIIAPNITEISRSLGISKLLGLISLGGINYFLIYIPMAFSSFFFFFYNRKNRIPLPIFTFGLAILHTGIFFTSDIYIFSTINFWIGAILGILIPTCYQYLKAISEKSNTMQTVGLINISMGTGLAFGQYLAGLIGMNIQEGWRYSYLGVGLLLLFATFMLTQKGKRFEYPETTEKREKERIQNKTFYTLLLAQYIPGSIPWGALTVYIFPFIESENHLNKLDSVNMLTLLGIGMIFGTYIAALFGDWLKKKEREWMIQHILIISFILSEVLVYFFLNYLSYINKSLSYIIIFIAGIILAFPGTYIKGILFTGLSEFQIRRIFSIENFLESLGKGLGPFIVSIFIFSTGKLLESMLYSLMFWNVSILILFFAFYRKRNL